MRTQASGRYAAVKAENSRLLREDVRARRTIYRGLPEVVTLNHSDICNLRCIMCQRSLAQGTHRLDRPALEHVANELFPTAWKAVLTTAGGDPLAVDFEFMLERALAFGVRLDVVTNGVLLSRDVYRRASTALDHLNVSLDCHVPAIYERIRAGASFARVWRNLEQVAEARAAEPDGVLFSLSAVVMRSNLPLLADFLRAVAPLRPDGVVFQRLLHGEKATPEEEPATAFSSDEIEAHFVAAERVAAELGINLFLSEFRRPNIVPRPPRAKVPMTLEGHGLCWFIAQNFNVMYTGEVFPCCIGTDLCLGDVRYEDPGAIWNGEPFQRLRRQHLDGTGNLFCTGCLHAPHLPGGGENREAEREASAKAYEAEAERRHARETARRPIWAAASPTVIPCDGGFGESAAVAAIRTEWTGIEVAAATAHGHAALAGGVLVWRDRDGALRDGCDLQAAGAGAVATCVYPLPDGAVLVAFAERGQLWRVDRGSASVVLDLSDPRAFVRSGGVTLAGDGSIWVGEYGVYPGARCAWLHRSRDGGRTFARVTRLAGRHVHRVIAAADGRVLVTTGDLAAERRLYRSAGDDFECLAPAWSGFVAAVERDGAWHFGTELPDGNGLLVWRSGFAAAPEFRQLPPALDLKVRALTALADGTLLALLGMDENLEAQRYGRRPTLLASRDGGHGWSVVHRFAADWSDEPDDLVPLGGMRVLAIGGRSHHAIDIAWAREGAVARP